MNLLLLEPDEAAQPRLTIGGRRARHLLDVLRATPGQQLRAGAVDGPTGTATVVATTDTTVTVEPRLDQPTERRHDVLLLAVPRPKVLLRMFEHAAALGVAHLHLLRTWKVEKSHLDSRALRPDVQGEHLRLGMEQAGRTQLPTVTFHPLFKPFVEDVLDGLQLPAQRFCADPAAVQHTRDLQLAVAPFALALGPDGGWLPYEIELLAAHGFTGLSAGPHALRTETALAVLLGQLELLRQRAMMPG